MVTSIIKTLSPEDTTAIQANQFPIKSVKLFSSGSAEITRTFPLSFLRSQDEPHVVEIVHLPAGVQSVDVSVTCTSGDVTILDHYHTSISKDPFGSSMPSTSQTLRELGAERLRVQDERRLRQKSFTFLTTYMDSLAQCKSHDQPEAAQMVSFFDEFVEIGVTRSAAIAELDGKIADVDGRIKEETERLSKLSSDLPVKIVAVLLSNSQVPVEAPELTVTYVVKQVSWKPAYDLHITMTGNTPSPTVTLDFRCTVTQWTGENWENVNLVLTAADQVSQLIQLPEPKRIDISLGTTSLFQHGGFAPAPSLFGQPSQSSHQVFRSVPGEEWTPERLQDVRQRDRRDPHTALSPTGFGQQQQDRQVPAAFQEEQMRERVAGGTVMNYNMPSENSSRLPPIPVVDEAALKVNAPSQVVSELISHGSKDPIMHIASGCIFIPSDNAAHHVLVTSLSLEAEFMRVVVPNIDARVYYTCEVKNTNEYVLLPGTVKAYLNDKHVSSTEIQNTELPQILECSLAIDTGVKTIHNRVPDALPSVGAFTGKATTTYTSATVLHNTHAEPIRGIIVRSSIPLPTDPRITIVLREPAGLAEIDEGNVSVKEGCLARWSTMGGRKGKQAGLFEWVCDVNPGTEVLKAVWEVCAPQDLKLLEQVRS